MDNSNTGLEAIANSIETAITGIPAPLRKNFFKAFAQLCTAAVDIPVSWLESHSAEIRAISEARVKLIQKEGQDFYNKTEVPAEYLAKASAKYASKIIKEQINLDEITLIAAKNLANDKVDDNPAADNNAQNDINEDWLNEFENQARLKSSEDMKIVFGKILSGEISRPGSFSIRTVKLISQLDNQAAKLFQTLCSVSVSLNFGPLQDARVVSFSGTPASNSLSLYGLSFGSLNVLQEYGLIISDYNSWMHYSVCVAHKGNSVAASFTYAGKQFGLIPTDKEKYDKRLQLHGVTLTKAGKELLSIIPIEEQKEYTLALIEFFKGKHLQLTQIQDS